MKITVTKTHIAKGYRTVPARCPVALALRAAFPEFRVRVGSFSVEIDHLEYSLPTKVCDFIFDFDAKFPVKPFSFVLSQTKRIKEEHIP